jgi:hypothetical protein
VQTRRDMKSLGMTRPEVYGEHSKIDGDSDDGGEINAEVNI